MTIADPTAIPQTPEEVTEYMDEADRLWNDGRTEEANTLYRAVFNGTQVGTRSKAGVGYRHVVVALAGVIRTRVGVIVPIATVDC